MWGWYLIPYGGSPHKATDKVSSQSPLYRVVKTYSDNFKKDSESWNISERNSYNINVKRLEKHSNNSNVMSRYLILMGGSPHR